MGEKSKTPTKKFINKQKQKIMSKEKITLATMDNIDDLRVKAGNSDKKRENAKQEFSSTPLSGTFSHVDVKVFEIDGTEYPSIGLYLESGEFISENALNQQNLLEELTEIKNGSRAKKFMLKSERLSDLSKLGASANARLVALQGKSYTAEKMEVRVYKAEFLDAVKFDSVCFGKNTDANLKKAWECTETKNGYIFTVS